MTCTMRCRRFLFLDKYDHGRLMDSTYMDRTGLLDVRGVAGTFVDGSVESVVKNI